MRLSTRALARIPAWIPFGIPARLSGRFPGRFPAPLTGLPAPATTLAVVAALAGLNVVRSMLALDSLWLAPLATAALLLFARAAGLSWSHLGLSRTHLARGALWGGGAIATVGLVYLTGVLLPATRPAFLDTRYALGPRGALLSALVVIPIGTVLLEEVAFRSVLWGMLARHLPGWPVLVISSALFGLWHVLPALHLGGANQGIDGLVRGAGSHAQLLVVAGTVAFTALGGVVAGELRRRSGSVVASAGMHWATNALGVLFGLLAWHLAS